ncbi:hypothetical protein GCM10023238_39320 [Streptomyces heliomycini]
MEHRIQLHRLRRTHLVPEDETACAVWGRSLDLRTDPVATLTGSGSGTPPSYGGCTRICSTGRCLDAVAPPRSPPAKARLSAACRAVSV